MERRSDGQCNWSDGLNTAVRGTTGRLLYYRCRWGDQDWDDNLIGEDGEGGDRRGEACSVSATIEARSVDGPASSLSSAIDHPEPWCNYLIVTL